MKTRGSISILAAAVLVAVSAANAHAAKLVWIQAQSSGFIPGTFFNANVPAGDVLYTLAVQTSKHDGVGTLAISLTFTGVAGKSPIQITSAAKGGIGNVQQLQDRIDAGFANVTASQYADSWFYSGTFNNGQVLDFDGNPAPTLLTFPGQNPNPLALAWNTSGSLNSITNTTGNSMSITGVWGNPTSSDPNILAASQAGGNRNVYPVAQILMPANSTLSIASGDTLGITAPNGVFHNVLGGVGGAGGAGAFLSSDPLAFRTNSMAIPIFEDPEPSTIILAALGLIGLVIFHGRRRHKLGADAL